MPKDKLLDQIRAKQQRGTKPQYDLSTTDATTAPSAVELPAEAAALSSDLRELALQFLGARRRIGEALLESARLMAEARNLAEEGQWYTFLSVTGISPDNAELLLNINTRAVQHLAFAEKIRSGWLNQTVAGELARPSTPPEVLYRLLAAETPPKVVEVKRARKDFQQGGRDQDYKNVDNPNYSGSVGADAGIAAPSAFEVIDADIVPSVALESLPETVAAELAALRAWNAQLERKLATARTLIEEYKPTLDRGDTDSPLFAVLKRVWEVLRER